MSIFYLPDLGEGLHDAEIVEWYVEEGDIVTVDQPMLAMQSDKAVVDLPAPQNGKIVKLYGQPGEVIKTGAPLVQFEGDKVEETEDRGTVVGVLESTNAVLTESATGITQTSTGTGIKAIPAVRALAKHLNIDLIQVKATGTGGQITLEDVERYKSSEKEETSEKPLVEGFEPVRGVRRVMALAMSQSHSEVVPVTLVDDADIQAWPGKTDITVRVIRAIVAACKAEPALNAWFNNKAMARKLHAEINLGIAMDSQEGGLFVPVIKDVANKNPEALRQIINKLKEQVNGRTVSPDDLKNATFILSNVGIFAGRYASPVVLPPTVAILAMGRIREEVVAHEGKTAIHRMMPLSLTIDHRVVTGGEAARFLAAVIKDLSI